jgi:hypothetical protein
MQVQPPQQAKNTSEINALMYVIEARVQMVSESGKLCDDCQNAPGRFTYETYGYKGIEMDVELFDTVLEGEHLFTEAFDQAFEYVFQKRYEAQSRGTYRVVGGVLLCERCLADFADVFLPADDSGAYTLAKLASAPGKVSCLFAWKVPQESEKHKIPTLLYTQAKTMEEVMPQLREPSRAFIIGLLKTLGVPLIEHS